MTYCKVLSYQWCWFYQFGVVSHIITNTEHEVLNLDKLTYNANLESLSSVFGHTRYQFSQTNICNRTALDKIHKIFQPDVMIHLAAESHIDRSITGPYAFIETRSYSPSSPYLANKASQNHLVRAWNRTYGLPVLVINCSNNYGPSHFPEKLIPLMILNALQGKALKVYGYGRQIRDWLFVEDHARLLYTVATQSIVGEIYWWS